MTYITLVLTSFIVCYIVGVSGFIDSLKHGLWSLFVPYMRYHPFTLKPFDCPACMTLWSCLAVTIYLHDVSIYTLSFVIFLSLMSRNITLFQCVLRDCVGWLISQIQKKI